MVTEGLSDLGRSGTLQQQLGTRAVPEPVRAGWFIPMRSQALRTTALSAVAVIGAGRTRDKKTWRQSALGDR
jgi:hypothetical protein